MTSGNTTIEFEGGFAVENITECNGFADSEGDYYYITNYFLSAHELETVYNTALELEAMVKEY